MKEPESHRWSGRFARGLGIDHARKEEIYLELDTSVTLLDLGYWLQIVFSAGIATLGLVLNSPAVIIGAMLISPLMGPILSAGLALAAGDLVLGLRTSVNLLLSCIAAIGFSVVLVAFLPFKELTAEIAARTNPTTLDLAVAVFAGAIGSIATSKGTKGVVTSIPGVAIAVALMPPLGVTGYGIGVALTQSAVEGMRVARGGGLLFLTNLVAITFTAMLVFLSLRVNTVAAERRIDEWRTTDPESQVVQSLLGNFHVSQKVIQIGGFYGRFLMILVPLLLILIPLSQSLHQLKEEYARQQQDNHILQVATEIWRQTFGAGHGGAPRSMIDHLAVSESDGQLTLSIRAFTSDPLTPAERAQLAQLVAAGIGRPLSSVHVQLLEIPTTATLLNTRTIKPVSSEPSSPTLLQLRTGFWQSVQAALADVPLPPIAELADRRVSLNDESMAVILSYLADRDMDPDAEALIVNQVRARMTDANAVVSFERIPRSVKLDAFRRNQASLTRVDTNDLEIAGRILRQHPTLMAEITTNSGPNESSGMAQDRANSIIEYLGSQWGVAHDRLKTETGIGSDSTVIRFRATSQGK